LHFYAFIIYRQHLDLEVHSDGSDVILLEGSLAKIGQKVCFADPAVADDDDFKQ
jgi:hypothetical protein